MEIVYLPIRPREVFSEQRGRIRNDQGGIEGRIVVEEISRPEDQIVVVRIGCRCVTGADKIRGLDARGLIENRLTKRTPAARRLTAEWIPLVAASDDVVAVAVVGHAESGGVLSAGHFDLIPRSVDLKRAKGATLLAGRIRGIPDWAYRRVRNSAKERAKNQVALTFDPPSLARRDCFFRFRHMDIPTIRIVAVRDARVQNLYAIGRVGIDLHVVHLPQRPVVADPRVSSFKLPSVPVHGITESLRGGIGIQFRAGKDRAKRGSLNR